MSRPKSNNLVARPPIVVVMGHIDHGKTTFLDFIRKTKVTECEIGGITQHVSTYEVETKDKENQNRKITFLDTPGHEAFSNIRSRGAKIADVAILIIAADDKVNTQTEEAIEIIKETGIPYVVAINKIDKENANPDKIKKELSEKEIFVEEWGGKVPVVNISAKTGTGINDLLEIICLVSDLEELKTDNSLNATGFVVESHIDRKRGMTATLIIQNGILSKGMFIVSKKALSPVRIFEDSLGCTIKEAEASTPIKITGFNILPEAGEEFTSYKTKKEAEKALLLPSVNIPKPDTNIDKPPESENENEEDTDEKQIKSITIPLVLKADTMGSLEALVKLVKRSETEKVILNILRSDVGDINEDDIKLLSGGKNSLIVGFNVKCPDDTKPVCERFEVNVKLFDIIYKAEEWLVEEVKKRKPVEIIEEVIGKAKIIKIFKDDKTKKIIGGEVISGKIVLGKTVKIYRRDFLLGEGKIINLQKAQTKTDEVQEGEQFGALVQTRIDIASLDGMEIIDKIEL